MDEDEMLEIERTKKQQNEQIEIEKSMKKRNSNVYRQKSHNKWDEQQMDELHNEMELEFCNLNEMERKQEMSKQMIHLVQLNSTSLGKLKGDETKSIFEDNDDDDDNKDEAAGNE